MGGGSCTGARDRARLRRDSRRWWIKNSILSDCDAQLCEQCRTVLCRIIPLPLPCTVGACSRSAVLRVAVPVGGWVIDCCSKHLLSVLACRWRRMLAAGEPVCRCDRVVVGGSRRWLLRPVAACWVSGVCSGRSGVAKCNVGANVDVHQRVPRQVKASGGVCNSIGSKQQHRFHKLRAFHQMLRVCPRDLYEEDEESEQPRLQEGKVR